MADSFAHTVSIAITAEDEASAIIAALQAQVEETQKAISKSTADTSGVINASTDDIKATLKGQQESWSTLAASIEAQTARMTETVSGLATDISGSMTSIAASVGRLPESFDAAAGSLATSKDEMSGTMDELVSSVDSKNALITASFRAMALNAKESMTSLDTSVFGGAAKTGASEVGLGGGMMAALTSPEALVAIGGTIGAAISVKLAADFQTQMTRLYTTAGETANQQKLGAGIQQIAALTGLNVNQLTSGTAEQPGAMYNISSAGFNGLSGLNILLAAAEAATAEGADPGGVANALTTAMNDYGYGPKSATSVMNQILTSVSRGKTTLQQLSTAMPTVLQPGSMVGLSLAQVLGPLSAMTAQGIPTDQAAQDERALMQELSGNMTNPESAQFQNLGLNPVQMMQQLPKLGITGTVTEIMNAVMKSRNPAGLIMASTLQNSTAAEANLKKMVSAAPASVQSLANELMSGQIGYKDFQKAAKSLPESDYKYAEQIQSEYQQAHSFNNLFTGNTPGDKTVQGFMSSIFGQTDTRQAVEAIWNQHAKATADENAIAGSGKGDSNNIAGWDKVKGNLSVQTKGMVQNLENLGRTLGTALLPAVSKIVGWLNDFVTSLQDVAHGSDMTDKIIRGVLKVGFDVLKIAVGDVVAAFKFFHTDVAAILFSVGSDVKNWIGDVVKAFASWWDMAARNLSSFASNISKWASDTINGIIKFFEQLPGNIVKALGNTEQMLYNAGKSIIDGLTKGISDFAHEATGAIGKVGSDVVGGFKSLLGIHSPSTVFAEAGQNIGQGLAQGIASTKGIVQDATRGITPTAETVRTSSTGVAPAGGSSTINLTVNVGNFMGSAADQQNLAKSIYQALQNIARQHGMAANLPMIGILPQ
jgi:TP901 family phage tail tape measure protein